MPDIDIDFLDREQALKLFKHVGASRIDNNKLVKHNTGVYLHEVPVDAVSGLAAVSYNKAEEQNFFKIDFLNVGIYKGVRDETHLLQLMEAEPLWDLLEQDDFANLLFHVNGHGGLLRQMRPTTVEQLAAVLAMIRPAKRYLIGKDWTTVMTEVWTKPENDEYFFKKSHATAYAIAIVVQMNLICEGISYGYT
jgi:DNA polymerase III alpha subunit|tara:strand:- start:3929 stop:4507 length:579 start_codon:yes stop_codon:yes gene_type:complete